MKESTRFTLSVCFAAALGAMVIYSFGFVTARQRNSEGVLREPSIARPSDLSEINERIALLEARLNNERVERALEIGRLNDELKEAAKFIAELRDHNDSVVEDRLNELEQADRLRRR